MFKKFMEGAVFAIALIAATVAFIVGLGAGIGFLVDVLGLRTVAILIGIVLVGIAGGLANILPTKGSGPR